MAELDTGTATVTSYILASGDTTARKPADDLRDLALHAEGVVTDDEFASKRRELLERM